MSDKRFLTQDEITRLRGLAHYTLLFGDEPAGHDDTHHRTMFVYEHLGIKLPIDYLWLGNAITLDFLTVQWRAMLVLAFPSQRTIRDHRGVKYLQYYDPGSFPMYTVVQEQITAARRDPDIPDWNPDFSSCLALWATNFGKPVKKAVVESSLAYFPEDVRMQVSGNLQAFERDLVLMAMDEHLVANQKLELT